MLVVKSPMVVELAITSNSCKSDVVLMFERRINLSSLNDEDGGGCDQMQIPLGEFSG